MAELSILPYTIVDIILKNLKDLNICTDHVHRTSEASSGVAFITVDDQGENFITIVAGSNLLLSKQEVNEAEATIKSSKVVVCQLECDMEPTLAALKLAKKHGVITVMNPAPAKASLMKEIYENSDYFCPNESEAELLIGKPVKNVTDAEEAINVLLELGCKTVVITLGENGVVFRNSSMEKPIHVKAEKVKPLDTTGAGDSFLGSLAYFLAKHPDLTMEEVLRRSCRIASISVQRLGAQSSFPDKSECPVGIL